MYNGIDGRDGAVKRIGLRYTYIAKTGCFMFSEANF